MPDRKLAAMHKEHGRAYGYKCVDCPWLSRVQGHTKGYYKCAAYGRSSSEATDWAKSWDACGLIDKSIDGLTPMVERLKHEKRFVDKPIKGQLDMFGGVVE